MTIPAFDEIIEQNDQTEARKASLEAIGKLVGNVYTNKFVRSTVSGREDTITALKHFEKVADVEAKMAAIKANLTEGERPPAEKKDELNNELKALGTVRIAGRLTTPTRGNFVHLTDGMSKLQVYCNKKGPLALVKNDGKDTLDEENGWALWQLLDHGDFIGVEGYLFVTNTGEVSVHVERLQFLAKAMLPMPDKMHGIADAEIRQRQRYYDLIGSSLQVKSEPPAVAGGLTSNTAQVQPPTTVGGSDLTTREVFERRAKIISSMRHFLEDHGYIEVETPMLTPKATGAAAKPFETHHNALDITLYARIAPELYLKRLVVGGFEKVYELNRNFRNEGISYKHNPEFTMLEFYCAYMDVNGMMDFCEELIRESVKRATGGLKVKYEGNEIDFEAFERISMSEAVRVGWKRGIGRYVGSELPTNWKNRPDILRRLAVFPGLLTMEVNKVLRDNPMFGDLEAAKKRVNDISVQTEQRVAKEVWDRSEFFAGVLPDPAVARTIGIDEQYFSFMSRMLESIDWSDESEQEKRVATFFEDFAERTMIQPTFITDFPKSISPLSKTSPENPSVAERFELFINGMEVANGFSELNDPREQYERFVDQMSERERGDEEAMILDEDYIRALSYGMPPAAGIGIGIDRLVMLLTNKHSIRDVILFPHMRPEKNIHATEDTESTEEN